MTKTDIHKWINSVCQITVMFGTLILIYMAWFQFKPALENIAEIDALKITYPTDGNRVTLNEMVAGTFFTSSGVVQLLVREPQGKEWLQGDTAKPGKRGEWLLAARFGEPDVGCGETFLLRAVWTESALEDKEIHNPPATALYSEEVSVIRICGN